MLKVNSIKTLLITLLLGNLGFSQIENGAIFEIIGGSTIKGELIDADSVFKVRLPNETIVDIKKNGILKSWLPEEINLYPNGKFNYKKGILFNFDIGFSESHTSMNLLLTNSLENGFEYGLGLGYHYNFLDIPASNTWTWIDVNSLPIFLTGKYHLPIKTSFKPYVKASAGYSNNITSWTTTQVNDGVMFQGGIGVSFSTQKSTKWYMELTQYSLHAKGQATSFDVNFNPNTPINFDVWFNKIVFNVGFFFGK